MTAEPAALFRLDAQFQTPGIALDDELRTGAEAAAKQLDEGLPVWIKPIDEAASYAVT